MAPLNPHAEISEFLERFPNPLETIEEAKWAFCDHLIAGQKVMFTEAEESARDLEEAELEVKKPVTAGSTNIFGSRKQETPYLVTSP